MRNDDLDLRADRDELHDYTPRAPQAKRQKSLVLRCVGVFWWFGAVVCNWSDRTMATLAMGTLQFAVIEIKSGVACLRRRHLGISGKTG